ncbi:hypothetical protein [Luteimonas cucumeris]|nr:hypothetical protein [Luteimonas cucumeris]
MAFGNKPWLAALAVLLCMSFNPIRAAEVSPESEYARRLKVYQTIQPEGDAPFGEQINLYNGDLSFRQTDIVLEGTGPTISLVRTTTSGLDNDSHSLPYAFGNWSLSIPRIETLANMGYAPPGSETQPTSPGLHWAIDGPDNPSRYSRCSQLKRPWFSNIEIFFTGEGWNGMELVTESGDRQPVIVRSTTNTLQPTMTNSQGSPLVFPGLTLDNWQVGCLATTSNGEEGEAFFVVSPDGTKYWIDHLTGERADSIFRIDEDGVRLRQGRMLARMYVSRVEDRFGNYLTYAYSGDKLTSITASDGRQVTIAWRSDSRVISSITVQPAADQPRTWQYLYANVTATSATLTNVVLPDGTQWGFNLSGMGPGPWFHYDLNKCTTRNLPDTGTNSISTITHPSGLVGKFTTTPIWHSRSYVSSDCRYPQPPEEFEPYEYEPPLYNVHSLIRREIFGPGVAAKVWTYGYSDGNGSTTSDPCAASGTCLATQYVDIRDPNANRTRYTYSNRVGEMESKLLQVDFHEGESTLKRREAYQYAASTFGPYPANPGYALSGGGGIQLSRWTPLKLKTITQQGGVFKWEAKKFDAYANPVGVTRSSNLAAPNSRSDYTDYLYNTNRWVIGPVAKVRDSADGLTPGTTVLQETAYDPTTALPTATYAFGALKQSFTYHPDGSLKTVKDPLHPAYTFNNYKRGIAQRIDFPDTKFISAVVDDFGQLSSVTSPLGHATGYGYDVMGRMTGINLPTGWNDSTIAFVKVTGAEYGIPANHWRRTVSKGTARSITYYDAQWQPILSYDYATNVAGSFVARSYDAFGRETFTSYPTATAPTFGASGWPATLKGTRTTYDALGRPVEVRQDSELGGTPLVTSYAYPDGFQTQVTDPRLAVTTTSYQAFDAPSTDAPVLVQLPEAVTTAIERDKYGKTLSLTRSGPHAGGSSALTRSYVYDSQHRLCRVTEPETGSTVTTYDAAGNVAWSATGMTITGTGCGDTQVPTAARITRTYDPMNRVKTIDYPADTGDIAYSYDAAGNVATAVAYGVSAAQDVVWNYGVRNSLGLPTSEMLHVDGFSYGLQYVYDPQGSLKTLTYPDGRVVDYLPDALGRATQAGGYVGSVQYFPDGDLSSYQYANGITYAAEKNTRSLPSNLTYAKGGLLYSQDLAYDANANLTNVTDLLPMSPSRTKTMTYDSLNRLSTATGLWGVESYAYDALDNFLSITRGGINNRFEYDPANRLVRIANAANNQTLHSYDYDTKGNVTTRDGATLSFDEANRLLAYAGKGGYRYDAWGRRVKRSNGSGVGQSYYTYSQAGQLLFEHDLGANKLTDYVHLGGKLVAKVAADAPVPALQAPERSTTGSYNVSWAAISGVSAYVLEESSNGGAWVEVYSGTALNWDASGKAHGSQYGYRAKACVGSVCGNYSTAVTVAIDLTPVGAPVITVPNNPTPNYTVSWAAVATATTYEIQESGSSGVWVGFYSGGALSKAVTGHAGGVFNYRGRACNTHGCGPWGVTVTTVVNVPPSGVPVLAAPPASNNGSYTINWGAVAGATKYTLEQSANGGAYATVQDTAVLSWSTSGKAAGSYAYRAKACNPAGCGGYSTVKTVVVTYPPTVAPTLTAPASNVTGSYTVSWTGAATATSYTLQRNLNGGTWVSAYSGGALSSAQGLSADGNYNYRVQACNAGGCGPWSATKVTHVEITPAMPATLSVVIYVDDIVRPPLVDWNVNWAASMGATSYDLEITSGTGTGIGYSGPNRSFYMSGRGTRSFRVRACKSTTNCSAWRSPTSIVNQ